MTATSSDLSADRVAPLAGIRAHFPALARRHMGHAVAYFDGPGGTQVPRMVSSAIVDYLHNHNANTHWHYPTSSETDTLLHAARVAGADFVNGAADEISFGNNMTTITYHVARALGRGWGRDDEVIVTELDHQANVAPWRALARERGVQIRLVRMDPATGLLDWDDLRAAFSSRTRLLAIGAASNALGTINDIAAASKLAHDAGALCFVDAVHYTAHGVIDVREWDCDFLACSPYKFYGPHHGLFWGRRALIEALDVPRLDPAPNFSPERLETGTQNHEAIVGTAAAIDFLASLSEGSSRRARLANSMHALHTRGDALVSRLWNGLSTLPAVTLYGPTPGSSPRTPTISFNVDGLHSDDVARALTSEGIFASNGDFYATTVIERIGRAHDGVVRAGCACYTSEEEVDRLIDGVRNIAAR